MTKTILKNFVKDLGTLIMFYWSKLKSKAAFRILVSWALLSVLISTFDAFSFKNINGNLLSMFPTRFFNMFLTVFFGGAILLGIVLLVGWLVYWCIWGGD